MAQMRSAAAGIGDDGIVAVRRKEVDHPPGLLPGQIQLAVVGVQGAAARLRRRRVDGAAVGEEHVRGVAVDVREHEILDAAGQERNTVPGFTAR